MPTLLKRYGNRRIYDTSHSRYVTLEEIATRIRAGEDFRVVDTDTDKELTKRVLLQIVLLESLDIAEILPLDFLKTLIRLKDGRIRDLFVRYLKMSMEAFALAQRQVEENMRLVHEQMATTAHLMKTLLPFGGGTDALGAAGSGSRSGEPARVEAPPLEPAEQPAAAGADSAVPLADRARRESQVPKRRKKGER